MMYPQICGRLVAQDQHPEEPAEWIDRLADFVELKRLCAMDVLSEDISSVVADASQLTTKFVYDWRLKGFKDQSGAISKRWLRRSRLVAREGSPPSEVRGKDSPFIPKRFLAFGPS